MRTVIEAPSVSEKIDAESSLYSRLEDAWDGLKWWLAHQPDSGELIDDFHWLFKQQGNVELKIPAIVVVYTFGANEVEILSALIRIPTL